VGATDAVADWIANVDRTVIPAAARRAAADVSFDVLGTMLAGAVQPLGRIVAGYEQELGGTPQSSVVVSGHRTSAAHAAYVNGTLGHALDFDDTNGIAHDAAMLFPSLLALCEREHLSGEALIDAYTVGFEVGQRLSRGLPRGTQPFHKMPTFGRIATAAACARLLGLNRHKTTMALGIAGSLASGLTHNHGTMTKPLHGGIAARDGVMAAELAARGFTAGDRILEHPLGFMTAFCGENADLQALLANLGNPFVIHTTVGIKKYPCGAANHPIIDTIFALMDEHGFSHTDVEEVEVQQSFESHYVMYPRPATGLEAKFSINYCAAAALVHRRVDLNSFTDEAVKDPDVLAMMERVRVRVLTKWEVGLDKADQNWPVGFSSGYAYRPTTVRLRDGRTFTRAMVPSELLGSADNPWGLENIAKKFENNAALALPPAKVRDASRIWRDIDHIDDIAAAVGCLTADA
jgi:2-methylcitrate dehydratase PrpD